MASEGLKDKDGNYLAAEKTVDDFGHVKLGNGLADNLKSLILQKIDVKVRCNILGTSQRSAMHHASKIDATEAYNIGREAVKLAVRGLSGVMMTLERTDYPTYLSRVNYVDLALVAKAEKKMPLHMINEEKIM